MILGDLVRGLWNKAVYVADVLNPFNSTVRKPIPRLGDDLAPAFHTRSALDLSGKDMHALEMPETVHHNHTSRTGKGTQSVGSYLSDSVSHLFHKETPVPVIKRRPLSSVSKTSEASATKASSSTKASTPSSSPSKAVGKVSPRTKAATPSDTKAESKKRGRPRSQSRTRAASAAKERAASSAKGRAASSSKEPASKKAKTVSTKKTGQQQQRGRKRKSGETTSPRRLRSRDPSHHTPTETHGRSGSGRSKRSSPSKTKY
ncbi:uncharacterized protein LOC129583286 [Paramacrobiotus metropolitanus]|uniref:uncharacterized protein LOC129583286 n=1 Tax=Paramacrobiotus metropolitanus TaxID=2943436 RepID=UPI0024456595|nr:uncharacterized protein LOC129583286 [Paramacrobiotus metropolitanus]